MILLVAWGTVPLGTIAAGFLLDAFGAVESMLVLAGVSLAVALGATLARTVRNVPRPDGPPSGRGVIDSSRFVSLHLR